LENKGPIHANVINTNRHDTLPPHFLTGYDDGTRKQIYIHIIIWFNSFFFLPSLNVVCQSQEVGGRVVSNRRQHRGPINVILPTSPTRVVFFPRFLSICRPTLFTSTIYSILFLTLLFRGHHSCSDSIHHKQIIHTQQKKRREKSSKSRSIWIMGRWRTT
jgi:hypothetical protein